jgi:hypothetical protein
VSHASIIQYRHLAPHFVSRYFLDLQELESGKMGDSKNPPCAIDVDCPKIVPFDAQKSGSLPHAQSEKKDWNGTAVIPQDQYALMRDCNANSR